MSEPAGFAAAAAHLHAAMAALGVPSVAAGQPEEDRETARRVHQIVPGVPAHQALAAVKALRAMGWGPRPILPVTGQTDTLTVTPPSGPDGNWQVSEEPK
jgi:hypothetical protein